MMLSLKMLPTLNALLNGTSALFILRGVWLIKKGKMASHKKWMLAALTASILFLTSYLIYHFQVGSIPFQGKGMIRIAYFAILLSHTILAIVIVPLVTVTLIRAWRGNFDRHKRIAKITFPLWLYVSITGVVVYWMLYHLN